MMVQLGHSNSISSHNLCSTRYWYSKCWIIIWWIYFSISSDENLDNVYLYDGLTWSADASLSCGRSSAAGNGTQNDAFAAGGFGPSALTNTEEYCRSFVCTSASCTIVIPAAWSAGGALIIARRRIRGTGVAASQNAALGFGGYIPPAKTQATEEYDGSSWSAGGTLITANSSQGGAGSQNAGLAFGGQGNTGLACTEEYNGSSWATGGALNFARYQLAGTGTQNAALASGGYQASPITAQSGCVEEYNGTAWSAGNALIAARSDLGGAGYQNATSVFGGRTPSLVGTTEEYDGTNWSTGGTMIVPRHAMPGTGTQNAALASGGYQSAFGTIGTCTEAYDGTTWSAETALIGIRTNGGGAGTQTATVIFGGTVPGSYGVANTDEFSKPQSDIVSFYNFKSCLRCLEGTTTSL